MEQITEKQLNEKIKKEVEKQLNLNEAFDESKYTLYQVWFQIPIDTKYDYLWVLNKGIERFEKLDSFSPYKKVVKITDKKLIKAIVL